MARPQKTGLDYFPLDVDIDQDDKVALIEAQHGIEGFAIIIKLLMKIYKNGYFYEWTEKEQLLFSNRINVDINQVNVIINDCVKWELFDDEILRTYKILTSRGIQRRYLEAVGRRQKVKMYRNYLILDIETVNVYKNLVIVDINEVNDNINPQSKVKKSKVKKSKELLPESQDESSCSSEESQNEIQEVYHTYQDAGYGTINQMTKEMIVHLVETYGSVWVMEALKIGLKNNKRKLTYVEGILQNWKRNGGMNIGKDTGDDQQKSRSPDGETERIGPDLSHIGYKGDGTVPDDSDLI
ncbi:Lin1244/Lin1753 domain-containing protein [Anaerophilus nitritogenes]|uniref:Lin1244/Lin1753 domain-containing protein n=1 Tax=Anaerophilus nitritogenes TaxID=2498136 RepID=UPI00101BC0E1|nr:Lin1244/Lin1753 domain-containing protein [Anaerophilus nitritogenes]